MNVKMSVRLELKKKYLKKLCRKENEKMAHNQNYELAKLL